LIELAKTTSVSYIFITIYITIIALKFEGYARLNTVYLQKYSPKKDDLT